MSDGSAIEWTDATWNPITGCTLVSEGCRNCYAAQLAATRLRSHPSRAGLARLNAAGEAKFTGEVRLNEDWLDQPLRWSRPRRIFVCAHGDLFHEAVPDEWIDRVFAIAALAPRHVFQFLSKRPERAKEYLRKLTHDGPADRLAAAAGASFGDEADVRVANFINGWSRPVEFPDGNPADGTVSRWPLPNVWLGTSVEDQAAADARIPHLLATPAVVRFLSAEPLLGRLNLEPWLAWPEGGCELPDGRYFGCAGCDGEAPCCDCPRDRAHYEVDEGPRDATGCPEYVDVDRITLDWVIVGGESGRHARPLHPDWARSLRDQCVAAGVPFFFKQWGPWLPESQDPNGVWNWSDAEEIGALHFWDDADRSASIHLRKSQAGRLLDGRTWDETPRGGA